MSDIARLAGVSMSTVSRALSGSVLVNDETRKRIEELAGSLNYSVNVSAKNLRLQQNRTIAVVVPYDADTRQNVSDPFFLSMLGSIADALSELGYEMLFSRIDASRLDLAAQFCDSGRACGVILIGQWHHHDQLNGLAARHVPIVVWGAQLPQQLYTTVGCDNRAGGLLATSHLLSLGRRRIAFFGDRNLPESAQRHEGYLLALAKKHVVPDPQLSLPVTFVAESARAAVKNLIGQNIAFDSIFACSDLLAMTAISTLNELGRRVPEDVSVVGYDDIAIAAYLHPPLTTIRQSIDQGGRTLVETLLALVAGERQRPKLLEAELIVRGTTRQLRATSVGRPR